MRIFWIAAGLVIAGLAIGATALLAKADHTPRLHHYYACTFAKDLRQEDHLPPSGAGCTY